MSKILRTLSFGLLACIAAMSMAQPFVIQVSGHMTPCDPAVWGSTVTIEAYNNNSQAPVTTTATLNENCWYNGVISVTDTTGLIAVWGGCANGTATMDSVWFSAAGDTAIVIDLICATSPCSACFTVVEDSPFTANFDYGCSVMGNNSYSLFWDFGDGGTLSGAPASHTYSGPGAYTVCLNLADADGCTSTVCHTVYVDAQGNVGLTPPTSCQACITVQQAQGGGMLTPFTANFTNCSTGNAPLTYQWWLPDGSVSTQASESWIFPGEGTYGVCLTIADVDGCSSIVCDTVYVDALGNVGLTPPPSCQACFTVEQAQGGGTLTPFVANFISCSDTAGGDISFNWQLPDGSTATGEFVTWTFPSEGMYAACLSISGQANTCQSTFCDTVYVDSNGLISTEAPWYDCLGVTWGNATIGTPCDDGDPGTVQDQWDPSCNCVGIPCVPLPDPLTLNLGPVANVCSTDSILQGVVDIFQLGMYPMHYAWSGPGVAASDTMPWIQLSEPGNFHLTLSNACSTSEADFVITINQAPDAGISASVTVCSTSAPFSMLGALGGTPGAGGTWTGPDGNPTPPIFDPATMPSGVYVYTVPGVAPCPNASATLTILIDDNQIWYADADGDGLGDPNVSVTACEQPVGYVGNAGDACPALYGTVGDACEDGNPFTMNDVITEDCVCEGTSLAVDCLGIPNGSALPGTECTITGGGMQLTGTWTTDCVCDTSATGSTDCQAGFWAIQAYSIDSLNSGGATPIPNEVWVWNLSSGGNGVYQFLWDFGDGGTSTEAYPVHEYDGPGPYLLCLTVVSGTCTDTYCDSISIDENGFLNGLVVGGVEVYRPSRSSGFTLRVIHSLPTGITPLPAIGEVRLWPNPAGDQVNLSFTGQHAGALPVAIMDLGGRVVWSGTQKQSGGPHTMVINVERLPAGSYLLQVGEGGNRVMLRFIKM